MPTGGGERACVADEGRAPELPYFCCQCGASMTRAAARGHDCAQPAPQAEAKPLLGPTARIEALEKSVAELWRIALEGVNGGGK